ncbi:MAG: type I restriction enzyme HsdR N-terminal domain-containing protein [Bacteroidales bacterium]|nr:type I restriction enzyme HsdR N-terminal domain-containing protein [Candidatus Colimorpha onthohippi]
MMEYQTVFDPVRQKHVALTPEERVRQCVIQYLNRRLHYPFELMQVEGTIALNGMRRRCDIVVYDRQMRPSVIVECKRPDVAITQKVIDQACRYNCALHVPYLLLTNGSQMLSLHATAETLTTIDHLPDWDMIK